MGGPCARHPAGPSTRRELVNTNPTTQLIARSSLNTHARSGIRPARPQSPRGQVQAATAGRLVATGSRARVAVRASREGGARARRPVERPPTAAMPAARYGADGTNEIAGPRQQLARPRVVEECLVDVVLLLARSTPTPSRCAAPSAIGGVDRAPRRHDGLEHIHSRERAAGERCAQLPVPARPVGKPRVAKLAEALRVGIVTLL